MVMMTMMVMIEKRRERTGKERRKEKGLYKGDGPALSQALLVTGKQVESLHQLQLLKKSGRPFLLSAFSVLVRALAGSGAVFPRGLLPRQLCASPSRSVTSLIFPFLVWTLDWNLQVPAFQLGSFAADAGSRNTWSNRRWRVT